MYTPGLGFVFAGMYDCTPWPVSDGGMYAGCCSFGLRTELGGCCATADAGLE